MSKHVFYVTAIIFLAIVCVVDYMRINKLQEELTDARKQIEEEFDAVEWKLDASIYKIRRSEGQVKIRGTGH